jgi:hypothetical protein
VASAATTFLFPSLGNAVGGALNSVVGNGLSEGVANALGNATVGGLIGGVSSGGQGALTGALAGGATSALMGATGYSGGLPGLLQNGTFATPGASTATAAGGGLRDANISTTAARGNAVAGDTAANSANAAGGALGMFGKGAMSPAVIAGLALAGGLGSSLMGSNKQAQNPQQGAAPTDPNMTRGLSTVAFDRTYRPPEGDLKTYGMRGGQHRFFENNQVPTVAAAEGGYMEHPMRSERAQYEQAHARLRQAEMARRAPVRETPDMRDVRRFRSQQAVEQGEMTGYAEGGQVQRRGGIEQLMEAVRANPRLLEGMTGVRRSPMEGMEHIYRGPPPTPEQLRRPVVEPDMSQIQGRYARGGVSGPGHGREDAIPAVLSDGEYVIDAETVALLGDGSSKAGAQKLDQMRQQIRRHKGGALARGQISPDAKPAIAYTGGR